MQDFLADRLLLDAIVTVVDAKHIEQHLDDKKPDGVENEVSFFSKHHPHLPRQMSLVTCITSAAHCAACSLLVWHI